MKITTLYESSNAFLFIVITDKKKMRTGFYSNSVAPVETSGVTRGRQMGNCPFHWEVCPL
jgi:hypothetical protein